MSDVQWAARLTVPSSRRARSRTSGVRPPRRVVMKACSLIVDTDASNRLISAAVRARGVGGGLVGMLTSRRRAAPAGVVAHPEGLAANRLREHVGVDQSI